MTVESDLARSRRFEMETYLNSTKQMYGNAIVQNGDIYDIAFALTQGFSKLGPAQILEDSRIIRILRYAVAPSISQMKFGQFFGLHSTESFEAAKLAKGSAKYNQLAALAQKLAKFVTENLDQARFAWLADATIKSPLAFRYAKNWTCSIASDQHAQTAYRTWRKQQQELAIVNQLVRWGYVKSGFAGTISKHTDVEVGEYTMEKKVRGSTVQKADVAFRSKVSKKLVLVEAKAVGVELDATKRVKECANKAADWTSSADLKSPCVVAVIAGFFTKVNLNNLGTAGVTVVWEHDLKPLAKV